MPHPSRPGDRKMGCGPITGPCSRLVSRLIARLGGCPVVQLTIFDFRPVASVLTRVPAMLDQLIAKLLFEVGRVGVSSAVRVRSRDRMRSSRPFLFVRVV
jgi:hypothetical protein